MTHISQTNYQDKIAYYQHKIDQAVEQLNANHIAFYSGKLERYITLEVKRQEVQHRMDEQLNDLLGSMYEPTANELAMIEDQY